MPAYPIMLDDDDDDDDDDGTLMATPLDFPELTTYGDDREEESPAPSTRWRRR